MRKLNYSKPVLGIVSLMMLLGALGAPRKW